MVGTNRMTPGRYEFVIHFGTFAESRRAGPGRAGTSTSSRQLRTAIPNARLDGIASLVPKAY